jgi:hypothetical protein
MEKTAVVETLMMSEKNNSIVAIKVANTDKLIVGAVQKVLKHIIILKPAAAEPVTLTFGDIESVTGPARSPRQLLLKLSNRVRKSFPPKY